VIELVARNQSQRKQYWTYHLASGQSLESNEQPTPKDGGRQQGCIGPEPSSAICWLEICWLAVGCWCRPYSWKIRLHWEFVVWIGYGNGPDASDADHLSVTMTSAAGCQ